MDGLDTLGGNLVGRDIQGFTDDVQVDVVHQGPVGEHPSFFGLHCVSREFLPVDLEVVAPGHLSLGGAKLMQGLDHGIGELPEVADRVPVVLGDETEADVAEVVVNGPTARGPPGDDDVMLLYVFLIDLLVGVLDRKSVG